VNIGAEIECRTGCPNKTKLCFLTARHSAAVLQAVPR
jgi:hypothetical protein